MIAPARWLRRIAQALSLIGGVAVIAATSPPYDGWTTRTWTRIVLDGCAGDEEYESPFCIAPLPGEPAVIHFLEIDAIPRGLPGTPQFDVAGTVSGETVLWADFSLTVSTQALWMDVWSSLQESRTTADTFDVSARLPIAGDEGHANGATWFTLPPRVQGLRSDLLAGPGDFIWAVQGRQLLRHTTWALAAGPTGIDPLWASGAELVLAQGGREGATLVALEDARSLVFLLPWWQGEAPALLDVREGEVLEQAVYAGGLLVMRTAVGELVCRWPDDAEHGCGHAAPEDLLLTTPSSVWHWRAAGGSATLRRIPDGPEWSVALPTASDAAPTVILRGTGETPHLSLWLREAAGGILVHYAFDPDAGFAIESTAAARAWIDDAAGPHIFDHPRLVRGPVGDRLIRSGNWLIWPDDEAGFVYDLSARRQQPADRDTVAP